MRRQGYLFRQLVVLIAVIALPLLALLGYNIWQSAEQARRAAYQAVENHAAGIAQDAESLLAGTSTYLAFLAERPLIKALDGQRCDPLLDGVVKRRQHVANVFVTDLTGRPICFSVKGPGTAPATFAGFAWFPQALAADDMVLSKPFLAPVVQRTVAAMSRPLRDASGRRIGTVTVLLDLESLQREWRRYTLPQRSRLTLLDQDATIMVSQPDFETLVGKNASTTVAEAMRANPSGVGFAIGVDGIERVFAFKPVATGQWRAAASIPKDVVFGEFHRQLWRSAVLGGIVVLAVLALAVLIARRLSAPLAALARTARSIASGELDARADESVPGEFHQLACEFNTMLEVRRQSDAALQRHTDFYTALSRTNGAIVRMSDPQALYQEICRICVEHGHASIAYISLYDGVRAEPVASAGPADAFLKSFNISLDAASPASRGPTARALNTGRRHISNDALNDPDTLPWREQALKIGTRAVAAFPFRRAAKTAGALSLHMTVAGFFDERMIDLIEEMAGDISFALDNFDREHARTLALRQADADNRRFRTLFQIAPVSMTIATLDGARLLAVNETYAALTGESPEAMVGRHAFDPELWPDEPARLAFLSQLHANNCVRNLEVQGVSLLDRSRDFLLQADHIEFSGKICVLTIATDITELRRARHQLHEREKQISGLVETAMDAIISIDSQHRIQLFNRAAVELFGTPASDAIGTRVERFIPPRLRAQHQAHVDGFARTGSTARRMGGLHTLIGLRGDGTEFPIEASISKLGEGDATLMTVVIRDATEMRRAEQSRLAQAAAEASNKAKTEFLSRMSHELRTPLNAVLGFSQLLQSDSKEPLSARQHDEVEHIRRAGWHLLALITDVLDMSKIEAGRIDVEGRSVDLTDLLDDAVRINESAALAQGIAVDPAYRRTDTLRVWADPIRLRQVMINLLSNAIKYNRPQGSVELRVTQEGERVCIDVIDSGLGMTAVQLEHLYEPFNRLGRERAPIEGTGLGLALTRQLVLLMQGSIDVESQVGVGTRVRVALPVHHAATPATDHAPLPPQGEESQDPPHGVVLYIEDNVVNTLLVEHLLARWPDVVLVQAENGRDGIEMARSTQPDLVLLDMRLPDMDGLAVLAALRDDDATRHCRVVALSASAMPEEVAAARAAGASDYWTKPLDFEHFLREMHKVLALRRPDRPVR